MAENRTMFSNEELRDIEAIVETLLHEEHSYLRIKGSAHEFFLNNHQNPHKRSNLVSEAWVNAVVQYMVIAGYEIKKK
jgi:hypothetical protein